MIRVTYTFRDGTKSVTTPLPFVSRESTLKLGTSAERQTHQQDYDGRRQIRTLPTDVSDEGKALARRMKMRLGLPLH